MKKLKTDTLLIGAGPAGMAAAMELSKKAKDFILIEASETVGGLSKTYTFTEADGSVFHTDNGPHRFFSKNPYLYTFIGDLLREDWITVRRITRQHIAGKYYDYPINALQALRNVGVIRASRMLIDYAAAKVRYGLLRKPIRNFEDYVIANFGRTLGEFNMLNYTEKIWGIPCADIHPDWAKQRIKGLDFRAIAKDMFLRIFSRSGAVKPKSLVDTFYYPRKGTGQIYEAIQTAIRSKGHQVFLQTRPVKISRTRHGFVVRLMNASSEEMEVECRHLVESIPVAEFLSLLDGGVPRGVIEAARKLKYRSQAYLFVTLDKPSVTNDQWIYFPEKSVPMGRVSEMKNFSSYMSPEGKTSLFIELFCFENDKVWNMTADELFAHVLPHCEAAGLFVRKEVRNYYRIAKKNVYPIYDGPYREPLKVVKEYLDSIRGLRFVGRPGRFRYNNQDHSLEMGILAAKSIIDGKTYDIESVGEESEYFESGTLNEKVKT